jgi:hypothetical protein
VPGNRDGVLSSEQNLKAWPSPTPGPVMGLWGLLLDIVKMEERETWPARFLRIDSQSFGFGV